MTRFSPKNKFVVAVIPIFLLVFGLSALYIYLAREIFSAEVVFNSLRQRIFALEEDREGIRTTKKVISERETDFERIRKFSVDFNEPVHFIEALEDLEERTGSTVAIDVEENRENIGELVFRLTVEGSEKSLAGYLAGLEFLPYEVRAQDLSFQRLSPGDFAALPARSRASVPAARMGVTIKVKSSAR